MGIAQEVQQETPSEPIVEEAPPPSPEAEDQPTEVVPEAGEDTEAPSTGTFDASILTDDEWKLLAQHMPDGIKPPVDEAELERRAEQRARTRMQEEQASRQATAEGYDLLIQNAQQSRGWLDAAAREAMYDFRDLERFSDPDRGDPDALRQVTQKLASYLTPQTLQQAVAAIESGSKAELGREQARALGQVQLGLGAELVKEFPFTDDEQTEFARLRYEDAQRGTLGAPLTEWFWQKLLDRAEQRGEKRGVEKGLKSKEAQAQTAEIVAKLKGAVAQAAPGVTPGGQTPQTFEQLESLYARGESTQAQELEYLRQRQIRGLD